MRWVKASERLPEKRGEFNRVVVRSTGFGKDEFGHEYRNSFVTYGFKNYDSECPKFYFLIGNDSFLTNENIEWLDESTPEGVTADPKDEEIARLKEDVKELVGELDNIINLDIPIYSTARAKELVQKHKL